MSSTCAKDGGANQSKTTMPPVSKEYRNNFDAIFGKSKLEERAEKESELRPPLNNAQHRTRSDA